MGLKMLKNTGDGVRTLFPSYICPCLTSPPILHVLRTSKHRVTVHLCLTGTASVCNCCHDILSKANPFTLKNVPICMIDWFYLKGFLVELVWSRVLTPSSLILLFLNVIYLLSGCAGSLLLYGLSPNCRWFSSPVVVPGPWLLGLLLLWRMGSRHTGFQ